MDLTTVSDFKIAKMPERFDTLNAPEVERDINEILSDGTTMLACDFSDTRYIASAGLRVMLIFFKKIKALKGKFVLLKLRKEVFDVLKLSGFAQLMDIRDSL